MDTTAVGTATASSGTTARGMEAMQSEDFFRILVTELQNQDPLKPTETSDMIGQVSDIRNIEVSKQLTDVLGQMANQQRAAGAGDMVGKFVIATMNAEDGTQYRVAGVVTGVRFDNAGSAIVELDTGESVPVSNITHLTSVEEAEQMIALEAQATAAAAEGATDGNDSSQAVGPLTWLGQVLGL